MYNFISMIFGIIASWNMPSVLQNAVNSWYVSHFKIDLSEYEFKTPRQYKSLNALFTRRLAQEREMGSGFVSPSDGRTLEVGRGELTKAYSIKGREYDVAELLGEGAKAGELGEGFDYLNIYLSPSDYHHYHAPCDLKVESMHYFKGNLYSVAPKVLLKVENLYPKNERVVLRGRLKSGKLVWLVFVGATNVGKMRFDFEPRIETNAKNGDASYTYDDIFLKKGEHIGNFELGSTIVVISQKDALSYSVESDKKVKFGESIGVVVSVVAGEE